MFYQDLQSIMELRHKLFLVTLLVVCSTLFSIAQNLGLEYTLNVNMNHSASGYLVSWDRGIGDRVFISRKLLNEKEWTILATVTLDTSYEDTQADPNFLYEYKVEMDNSNKPQASYNSAFGYGILDLRQSVSFERKSILILIDSALAINLEEDIEQLKLDLNLDGFDGHFSIVPPTMDKDKIKSLVLSHYYMYNISHVYIIGHITVPYAGFSAPDGHQDHLGAWPCDGYYGDINNELWTEHPFFNYTNLRDERNSNRSGDGKFDQNVFPSELEIAVSRIDFSNLPSFNLTEVELTKNYLKNASARKRGLLKDNGKALSQDSLMQEADGFGNNFYRNFDPILGRNKLTEGIFLTDMTNETYLAAFAASYASDTGSSAIATTRQIASVPTNSIFKLLSGSYFGDWDTQDNYLRANLASGQTLNVMWVGRPNYFLHHLAANKSIGDCYKLSCNNNLGTTGAYQPKGAFPNSSSMSLLGDPTIRLSYKNIITNLVGIESDSIIKLTWATDPNVRIHGFAISKYNAATNRYEIAALLDSDKVSYFDYVTSPGQYKYIVNAIFVETNFKTQYQSYSFGKDITVNAALIKPLEDVVYPSNVTLELSTIYNDLVQLKVNFTAKDTGTYKVVLQRNFESTTWVDIREQLVLKNYRTVSVFDSYFFDTLSLNVPTEYRAKCIYLDSIVYSNDTFIKYTVKQPITVYPNPCFEEYIYLKGDSIYAASISIIDNMGRLARVDYNEAQKRLNLSGYRKGLYTILVNGEAFKINYMP